MENGCEGGEGDGDGRRGSGVMARDEPDLGGTGVSSEGDEHERFLTGVEGWAGERASRKVLVDALDRSEAGT